MMRLGFPRGNKNNNDGSSATSTAASIFSNLTNSAMSITGSGGNSVVHGSSAIERAAAAAAANAQYAPGDSDDLPPGWRLVPSRATGRDYYLHLATNATQWDKPTEAEPRKGAEQAVAHQRSGVFSTGASRLGAGLTSMLAQAKTLAATTATAAHATTGPGGTTTQQQPTKALSASQTGSGQRMSQDAPTDRDGQLLVEAFENERLDGPLTATDPKRFSDRDAAAGTGTDALMTDLPEGHEWVTEWVIDTQYTAVDRDGWTYATDFVDIVRLLRDDLSHATRHPTDAVRRRRWIRYRQVVTTDDATLESPRDASDAKALGSSSSTHLWGTTTGDTNDPSFAYSDDPFQRTAAKQQSSFRVNMKFPHRGTKDVTKDYQSITLTDVLWLVNAHDNAPAPTDALLREKTANLEEQIKDATTRSVALERALRAQHVAKAKELETQQHKFAQLVAQFRKVESENQTLQQSVAAHRATVETLRKEVTEKDMLANEEQRALNAEMAAANQALEEKAKALATARMRYKRDNKTLAASLDAAKKRLETHRAKANDDAQDPLAAELAAEMDRVRTLHAKLEAVRQHRLAVEEESKALFNQVVEKKADLKFRSKKKMETALKDVDAKLQSLKTEQTELSKRLALKPEGDALRQLNARRNDIRSELGALKERRTMLLAEKRKQDGVEL